MIYTSVSMMLPKDKMHVDFGANTIQISEYEFGHGITLFATPEQMLQIADEIYKQHGTKKTTLITEGMDTHERVTA